MNQIQTAGQQRYYDFIEDRAKKVRTGMIVWSSLLCLALISLFHNIVIAVILALVGAALAVSNMKSQKELKGKLDAISDKEEFFRQLTSPDVQTAQDGHVLVAKDYVLTYKNDVHIYCILEKEKVEVGIQGNMKKYLFLTDSQGRRHEIMSCMRTAEDSAEFDKIYAALKGRLE